MFIKKSDIVMSKTESTVDELGDYARQKKSNRIVADRFLKNSDALSFSYIPKTMPHREKEAKKLIDYFYDILDGKMKNLSLCGATGTGKTATFRKAKEVMSKIIDEEKLNFKLFYIRCSGSPSMYMVIVEIAKLIDSNVAQTGWAVTKYFNKIIDLLNKNEELRVIICLDEVDEVSKDLSQLIYMITRINEEIGRTQLGLVTISNQNDWDMDLDDKASATFRPKHMYFAPYDAMQLKDILNERIKEAFHENTYDDVVPALAAAFASQTEGDVRTALEMLRIAAEIANTEKTDKVMEEHVRRAKRSYEETVVESAIETMPVQQKYVFTALVLLAKFEDKHNVKTERLYKKYSQIAIAIGAEPSTKRYMLKLAGKLINQNLICSHTATVGRARTKTFSLTPYTYDAYELLKKDSRVGSLCYK